MNWFSIIKENRLVSQNITHTKVDENKPEQTDDRCKKKLEQLLKDLDRRMRQDDITGPPNMYFKGILSWEGNLADMLAELRGIPEEICCEILEGLRKISSGEYSRLKFDDERDMTGLSQLGSHLLTVRDKQIFHEIEKFAHPHSILDYLESPLFSLGFSRFLGKHTASFKLKVHEDIIRAYKLRGQAKMYHGQRGLLRLLDGIWQSAHEAITEAIV
jgi:hypothetical protein